MPPYHLRLLATLALPTLLTTACNGKGDEAASTETGTDTDTGSGDGDGDGDGEPGDGDGESGDGDGDACTPGEIVCADGVASICDEDGMLTEEPCSDECVDGLGCVACVPGSGSCDGDTATVCLPDGSGYDEQGYCDPLQGLSCDAGSCLGACAEITGGFLGCDFYPTVTAAMDENGGEYRFGVVVSNGNDQGVNICITQGGSDTCQEMGFIGPNTVQTYELEDVPGLRVPNLSQVMEPSVLIEDASYRVRTDLPVSVYQFNPHPDFVDNSADASLLFPVRAWGDEYFVVARNHWSWLGFDFPGFYAVVASEQDTTVTLLPSNTGGIVGPGGGVAADGTGQVTLHRGDVLQVFSWRPDVFDPGMVVPSDVTGTRVVADKPIQVIGGSKCTNVPFDSPFCDRLEDSVLPMSLASTSYIISAPVTPVTNGSMLAQRMVRIVATEDGTNLSYNPNVPGAPTSIEYAGDYIEFSSNTTFAINASKKVLVAEYMTGSDAGGGGDPSMALAIPTERFLSSYLIVAPTSYTENWVNVVFDKDTVIDLNGNTTIDAEGAEQIGVSSWRIKRVQLSNAGDGTHRFRVQDGGMPFGLTVYGYSSFISYWYPGGIDLPTR
jgi:hypothetical protein